MTVPSPPSNRYDAHNWKCYIPVDLSPTSDLHHTTSNDSDSLHAASPIIIFYDVMSTRTAPDDVTLHAG